MWRQNLNACNLYIVGKEIFFIINIVLRAKVQKRTYFELMIENQKDFRKDILESCRFFVKTHPDMKK